MLLKVIVKPIQVMSKKSGQSLKIYWDLKILDYKINFHGVGGWIIEE